MSISTHYTHQNPYFGAAANDPQVKSDFQSLGNDLNSSDIASAQKDFASLLSDVSKAKAAAQSAQTGSSSQSTALNSLSTALQSGDVNGAKTAFSSLTQTAKGHHHHHHHQSDSSTSDASAPEGFSCDAQTDPTAIKNDLNALSSALQSGDVTTAQQALIQLQKDDPKLANNSNPSSSTNTAVTAVSV
jgi:soluble cytochrome b562